MDHEELISRIRAHTFASWIPQNQLTPLSMSKAEGVYFWDQNGNRYLELCWP